jgi:hypothetical protein
MVDKERGFAVEILVLCAMPHEEKKVIQFVWFM